MIKNWKNDDDEERDELSELIDERASSIHRTYAASSSSIVSIIWIPYIIEYHMILYESF